MRACTSWLAGGVAGAEDGTAAETAGWEGLSAGAVACGDLTEVLLTASSGTHPSSSSEAAASTSSNALGSIFNPLNKPMNHAFGHPCFVAAQHMLTLIVLPGPQVCE